MKKILPITIFFILIFSGCASHRTLIMSENGKISLKGAGIWNISEPELLNQYHTSISFLDNGNVYIWKGNSKEIVGFNQKGKKIFDTSPIIFYSHLGELHLFHDGKIIGEYFSNNEDFRLDIGFLIFDENGKIKDKWYWDFRESQKYTPYGHNIHILSDSLLIVSGHGWVGKNQMLFGKFKYPKTDFLTLGGSIGPGYDGGGLTWSFSKSIMVDSSLFYVVATSPLIRELNLDLEFASNKGVQGKHYNLGDLENKPNFGYWDYDKEAEPFQDWMMRNSRTIDLFQHGNYSCVLYREVFEDNDKYWCQVYSKDFENYYGEIQLPEMPIGRDSKYIYFRDMSKNEPRIMKTKIRVK